MKIKKLNLIILFIITSFLVLFFIVKNNTNKIYLSDKYYNNGDFINITSNELEKLDNDTYILYIYNNYCSFTVPCEDIFKEYMEKYNIDFISMKYEEFKKTTYHNKIKYAPSIIIISKGKIIDYLDPEKDSDINKYQDITEFTSWLNKHIMMNKQVRCNDK